jgi:hypothetical protein
LILQRFKSILWIIYGLRHLCKGVGLENSLYWFREAIDASSLPPPVIKNNINVRNKREDMELAVQVSLSLRMDCYDVTS